MLSAGIFREIESHFCVLIVVILLSGRATLQQEPFQCGIPQVSKTELIVQGFNTAPGAWPWHAAVYHRKKDLSDQYVCGGTLISEQFVLTAAHCILNPENRQQLTNGRIFVRLGVHNLEELNILTFRQHNIYKIHKPTNFTGYDFRNDIAILELDTVVKFNDYVQPACLSFLKDLTGQYGSVIGWGVTEHEATSPILKSARMPVVSDITCLQSNRAVFGQTLDEGIFCAGFTNGTSVCNGDSGGGLFFKVNNTWYLGGIVSYAQKREDNKNLCHTKSYGAFTKVHTYLSWISSVTKLQLRPDLDGCEPKDVDPSATYTKQLLPRNCGTFITNLNNQGHTTNVFEFPWMAILWYKLTWQKELFHRCAGTLISKRYILTSAYCIKEEYSIQKVTLGEHTIGQDRDCNVIDGEEDCAPPVRDYGIECTIRHQNFSWITKLNDIALIRLDRDVQFEDHIQPICLPVSDSLRQSDPQKYIVTGWGTTRLFGDVSKVLLMASVTPAERSKCQLWIDEFGLKLDQSKLCVTQPDGADSCLGDDGGPLGYSTRLNGMRFIQFGIVSYGVGCGYSFSIFTKVAPYMNWILANMKS